VTDERTDILRRIVRAMHTHRPATTIERRDSTEC